jgi:hypothetical protein
MFPWVTPNGRRLTDLLSLRKCVMAGKAAVVVPAGLFAKPLARRCPNRTVTTAAITVQLRKRRDADDR